MQVIFCRDFSHCCTAICISSELLKCLPPIFFGRCKKVTRLNREADYMGLECCMTHLKSQVLVDSSSFSCVTNSYKCFQTHVKIKLIVFATCAAKFIKSGSKKCSQLANKKLTYTEHYKLVFRSQDFSCSNCKNTLESKRTQHSF